MKTCFSKFAMAVLFLCTATGCTLSYTIHDPQVSSFQYQSVAEKKTTLRVTDQRKDPVFQQPIDNLKKVKIELKNVEDPVKWFASSLEKELAARGIPVRVVTDDQPADMTLNIKKYQIVSYRVSGFSPWETYHSFRGELTAGGQTSDIFAYFANGHVPKWSMGELERPCFEIPMSIVVKDVASKINQQVFKYQAGNEYVEKINGVIVQKLAGDSEEGCLPAIELGATNNPAGLSYLLKLADHENQFVRACSLSAIGTLGTKDQLDFLKNKFTKYDYVDHFMALKSIGDMGTPDADEFIKSTKSNNQFKSENGYVYFMNLYLGE